MNPIKSYVSRWTAKCMSGKVNGIVVGHFFLLVPHIIASIIFIIIFPLQWIGILILGILISDLSLGIHNFLRFIFPKLYENFKEYMNNGNISFINHTILFSAIIIVLLLQEYVLFYAGLAHLFLDMIGF